MRDHLRFVITNWYLSDLAFTNKNKLKYIVTAFVSNLKHEGEYDYMKQMQQDIEGLYGIFKADSYSINQNHDEFEY